MAQLNWQSSYDATALRWGLSYEEEGAGSPPAGTVTLGAITPTSTGASIAFTDSDDDETGFEYRIDAGTAQAAGASSPLVIADLAASTEYDIEIRAINADGEGAWSSVSTFETRMANAGERATIVRKLSIVAAPVPLPDWVQALDIMEWGEVPNSALSSVDPPSTVFGKSPRNKTTSWTGGTLRRAGSVFILGAAGGHGDYWGNEVNSIALNRSTASLESEGWVERKAHSPLEMLHQGTCVHLDMTRAAVHTYCNTQYDQKNDRMLIIDPDGGLQTPPPPWAPEAWDWLTIYHPRVADGTYSATRVLMAFDFSTNEWLHPDTLGRMPAKVGGFSGMCCANPFTNEIYCATASSMSEIHRYTPSTDTFEYLAPASISQPGSAVDPINNRILLVGNYNGTIGPRVFDIDTKSFITPAFGGLGASVLVDGSYPGVMYDEVLHCWWVMIGGGGGSTPPSNKVEHLYAVDCETFTVTEPTTTGTIPDQRQNGVHNALQYVPELRGLVFWNVHNQNLKFLRTS